MKNIIADFKKWWKKRAPLKITKEVKKGVFTATYYDDSPHPSISVDGSDVEHHLGRIKDEEWFNSLCSKCGEEPEDCECGEEQKIIKQVVTDFAEKEKIFDEIKNMITEVTPKLLDELTKSCPKILNKIDKAEFNENLEEMLWLFEKNRLKNDNLYNKKYLVFLRNKIHFSKRISDCIDEWLEEMGL